MAVAAVSGLELHATEDIVASGYVVQARLGNGSWYDYNNDWMKPHSLTEADADVELREAQEEVASCIADAVKHGLGDFVAERCPDQWRIVHRIIIEEEV